MSEGRFPVGRHVRYWTSRANKDAGMPGVTSVTASDVFTLPARAGESDAQRFVLVDGSDLAIPLELVEDHWGIPKRLPVTSPNILCEDCTAKIRQLVGDAKSSTGVVRDIALATMAAAFGSNEAAGAILSSIIARDAVDILRAVTRSSSLHPQPKAKKRRRK